MTTCRYTASDTPRIVVGRHTTDCAGETCGGCQPCVEPHCRVCSRAHADGSCAECVAETRDTLHDIAAKCDALPDEVAHRGIDGEAMMLLGPAADPEAWRNRAMSAIMGRLDAAYLEDCRDELHPLWVLGTWEQVWRDHLDQPTDLAATLPRLVDYLDRQMHLMADQPEPPFEDFARDLRRCLAHLEAVLHDGEQRDTGAPCLDCGVPLVREWGKLAAADGWRCPRCRQWRSDVDYRLNVADLHREEAAWLTAPDMQTRTGVRAGTVRVWANRGQVERRRDSGRTLYAVADVMRHAEEAGLAG